MAIYETVKKFRFQASCYLQLLRFFGLLFVPDVSLFLPGDLLHRCSQLSQQPGKIVGAFYPEAVV